MDDAKRYMVGKLLQKVCQDDDERSFEGLFKLFYLRLLNFCIQYVDNRESAEEIVSDVFTKLWLARKNADQIQNLETYLFIAVKNRSLNHLKQFSRYRVHLLEDVTAHSLINLHNPEKELVQRELIFKMDQAINSLPEQCRIIFSLVKEDGLKYKEVAEILGISPRTVETQLVRALKKLDKIIAPYISSPYTNTDHDRKKPNTIKSLLLSIIFFSGL